MFAEHVTYVLSLLWVGHASLTFLVGIMIPKQGDVGSLFMEVVVAMKIISRADQNALNGVAVQEFTNLLQYHHEILLCLFSNVCVMIKGNV